MNQIQQRKTMVLDYLRAPLSLPRLYDAFQKFIGGNNLEKIYSSYIAPTSPQKVLDIGAGTSNILEYLPKSTHYTGIEPSEKYVQKAKTRWTTREAKFHVGTTNSVGTLNQKFDMIIMLGVLHHVSDEELAESLEFCKSHLNPDGLLLTVDPTFIESQHWLSRLLVSLDRGQFVRDMAGYRQILSRVFSRVQTHHRNDLLNIAYDHCIAISKV